MATARMSLEDAALGSFGPRLAARLLDGLINLLTFIPIMLIFRVLRVTGLWAPAGGNPQASWRGLGAAPKFAVILAFFMATGFIYSSLLHSSPWQATFGKRLFNLYVTGNDGRRISLTRSCARWLTGWFLGWFGGDLVSLVTILAMPRRTGLHDLLAGTAVWRGRPVDGKRIEPWRIVACFGLPIVWVTATLLLTM